MKEEFNSVTLDATSYNVDFENNTVKLPKIGEIKALLHKTFEGDLKPLRF